MSLPLRQSGRRLLTAALTGLAVVWLPPVAGGIGSLRAAGSQPTARVAFTRLNNVFLAGLNGTARVAVTTRGTDAQAANPVSYPFYSWSPDGKYLLLVRWSGQKQTQTLLLLDARGTVLRTLASGPPSLHFFPSWALDADQIVYDAWERPVKNARMARAYHAVNRVDLAGHKAFAWWFYADDFCESEGNAPAEELYAREFGTDITRPSMQWSVRRHLAVYSTTCFGGLLATDTRTGQTRRLGSRNASWYDAALSPLGVLAVASGHGGFGIGGHVLLANPRTGAVLKTLPAGESPIWSPDGQFLYFTHRTPGRTLPLRPVAPAAWSNTPMQTFTSAIWETHADGSGLARFPPQDAYAFGPLHIANGGQTLVYSRVDNPWTLWRHRRADNRYTDSMLRLYGPRVQIQRVNPGDSPVTIVSGAGRPEVPSGPTVPSVGDPTPEAAVAQVYMAARGACAPDATPSAACPTTVHLHQRLQIVVRYLRAHGNGDTSPLCRCTQVPANPQILAKIDYSGPYALVRTSVNGTDRMTWVAAQGVHGWLVDDNYCGGNSTTDLYRQLSPSPCP